MLGSIVWLAGCGPDEPVDPCPGGVCAGRDAGGGGGLDGSTPPADGGGGGPTDAGGGGGTDGSVACVEAWSCTPWQTDGTSDAATRTCTDANACGTTTSRPMLSVTLPALDRELYECSVEPILDRGCAQLACHGTEEGRALRTYARGRLRITTTPSDPPSEQLHRLSSCLADPSIITPPQDCIGSIECECWVLPHTPREWQRNFDAARGFALDPSGAPLADVTASELLRQPEVGGGFAHAGIHFWRPGDADYEAIRSWLSGATLGRTCNSGN
ncbi:MAG: hypothetical protein R3B82_12890 [Sandaracinaceae bacterium]